MKLLLTILVWVGYAAALVPRAETGVHSLSIINNRDAGPAALADTSSRDLTMERSSSDLALRVLDESLSTNGISKAVLLLGLKQRLIYLISARASAVIVKAVVEQLEKHNIIGKPDKATLDFITGALEKITIIFLTMALLAGKENPGGIQKVDVGVDAGKKVKRSTLLLDESVHTARWDLLDDEAHSAGNRLLGRAIVGDDLRGQMLGEGLSNVTVIHTPGLERSSPILAYHGSDGRLHFHWRAQNDPATEAKAKDTLYTHHYPFFAADGAGFKISAHTPINPQVSAVPEEDAKRIAQVIVQDYLNKRALFSVAGYEERYKTSNVLGHRLCYIAENKKFGLKDEFDKCFPKGK